jgi:carbon starvation protein
MNTILMVLLSGLFFFWGYRFYLKIVAKRFNVNPQAKTPAYTEYDGVDFIPARNWFVLFGHHFSSIAGAAPVIGPVVALSIWGWAPAVLWVILGSIFIGGIHDFASLIISVKNKGQSIANIAQETISAKARLVFAIFVFLALILVIAVFAFFSAQTFVTDSRVVLPSLGLIPVALLVGFLLYKTKANQVLTTIVGLLLLVILVWGSGIVEMPANLNPQLWIVLFLLYAFVASCLPVNILLQPRDYLSVFLLFFGIFAGYLGVFIVRPELNIPAFVNPQQFQPLWPMLFVTVACGAVSGFHSLIASGTTSKQINSQNDAHRIGYGAMILEAILALLAVWCVAGGIKSQPALKALIDEAGPVAVFSKGFGVITQKILGSKGELIGVVILNAFILTTLDTATRIARYILQELTGIKNRWLATLLVVLLAGYLALGGRWKLIWPIFGASNQLVAALTLFIVTSWLLMRNKPYKIILAAATFMLFTTIFSLLLQIKDYFAQNQLLLLFIALLLIFLAFYVLLSVIKILFKKGRVR